MQSVLIQTLNLNMSKYSTLLVICSFLIAFVQAVPEGRIVGGEEAMEGQFPHQISLRIFDSHSCGGSIISSKYIVTAAHCVTDNIGGVIRPTSPKLYTVYAGSNNRFEGGVEFEVESITVHDEYRPFYNDIALLKLAEPLTFTKNIQPIRLARSEPQEGSSVVISGWGDLKSFGATPTTLQWTVLSYITMDECKRINSIFQEYSETLICLAHEPKNGACNGDSGGPATFNNELIGVCAFSIGRCGSIYPDGYTKISYFLDWIKKNSDYSSQF